MELDGRFVGEGGGGEKRREEGAAGVVDSRSPSRPDNFQGAPPGYRDGERD